MFHLFTRRNFFGSSALAGSPEKKFFTRSRTPLSAMLPFWKRRCIFQTQKTNTFLNLLGLHTLFSDSQATGILLAFFLTPSLLIDVFYVVSVCQSLAGFRLLTHVLAHIYWQVVVDMYFGRHPKSSSLVYDEDTWIQLLKELYTVLSIQKIEDIRRSLHGLREKLGMA